MSTPPTRREPPVDETRRAPDGDATRREPGMDGGTRGEPSKRIRTNLPPDLLERYSPITQLGSGGEADVLLCAPTDEPDERIVVKLYRPEIQLKRDAFELLRSTADDPNHVVRLHDFGCTDGEWWEVLEYIEGGTLAAVLEERGTLTDDECRQLVADLVDAIAYLHEVGVTHRDIKPSNLLVRDLATFDVALADFGQALVQDMTTIDATRSAGTVGYQPPESLIGSTSAAYDLWPVGIIAYEALTGDHPLANPDGTIMDANQADRVLHFDVVDTTALDPLPDWQHLVRGLLHRDPRSRFGVEEVRAWLAGDPPVLPPDTVHPERAQRPYPFDGDEYANPAQLAAAFAGRWRAAARLVGGPHSWQQLCEWLVDVGGPEMAELVDGLEQAGTERRITRLIGALAPDVPPVYRDVAIDPPGLRALAETATVDDDEKAAKLIDQLFEARLIAEYTHADGCQHYADVHTRWYELDEALTTGIDMAVREGSVSRPPEAERLRARCHLLLSALDPGHVDRIRRAAKRRLDRDARAQSWLPSAADATPAQLLTIQLLAGAAAARTREERAAAHEEERQRKLERRQRHFARQTSLARVFPVAVVSLLLFAIPWANARWSLPAPEVVDGFQQHVWGTASGLGLRRLLSGTRLDAADMVDPAALTQLSVAALTLAVLGGVLMALTRRPQSLWVLRAMPLVVMGALVAWPPLALPGLYVLWRYCDEHARDKSAAAPFWRAAATLSVGAGGALAASVLAWWAGMRDLLAAEDEVFAFLGDKAGWWPEQLTLRAAMDSEWLFPAALGVMALGLAVLLIGNHIALPVPMQRVAGAGGLVAAPAIPTLLFLGGWLLVILAGVGLGLLVIYILAAMFGQ